MQYYLTDKRGALIGGPFEIRNPDRGLPPGAVVTNHDPPPALSGEVIIHAGSGQWISAAEPEEIEDRVLDITPFRLLFELMHPIEQLFLAARFRTAKSLNSAQMLNPSMSAETNALVRLDNAYERIDRIVNWDNKGYFNIKGPEALDFLNACRSLEVFGPNDDGDTPGSEAAAALRIQQIRNNEPYPQL